MHCILGSTAVLSQVRFRQCFDGSEGDEASYKSWRVDTCGLNLKSQGVLDIKAWSATYFIKFDLNVNMALGSVKKDVTICNQDRIPGTYRLYRQTPATSAQSLESNLAKEVTLDTEALCRQVMFRPSRLHFSGNASEWRGIVHVTECPPSRPFK